MTVDELIARLQDIPNGSADDYYDLVRIDVSDDGTEVTLYGD